MLIKRKRTDCDYEIEREREEYLDVINEDNGDKIAEKRTRTKYTIIYQNLKQ